MFFLERTMFELSWKLKNRQEVYIYIMHWSLHTYVCPKQSVISHLLGQGPRPFRQSKDVNEGN